MLPYLTILGYFSILIIFMDLPLQLPTIIKQTKLLEIISLDFGVLDESLNRYSSDIICRMESVRHYYVNC